MKNMREVWKEIPGYVGIYLISNWGRAKVLSCTRIRANGSLAKHKEKMLAVNPVKVYRSIDLCHPLTRVHKKERIHVLVAEAFLGPRPSPNHEVNHIDGVKNNCHVFNLEWGTQLENHLHALEHQLMKNILLEKDGEKLRISKWAKKLGIKESLIRGRLRRGHAANAALDKSGAVVAKSKGHRITQANFSRAKKYKNGLSATEWAERLGINRVTFKRRHRCFKDERIIYHKGPFPRSGIVI